MNNPPKTVAEFVLELIPSLTTNRVVDSAVLLRVMPPVPQGVAGASAFFELLGKQYAAGLQSELQVTLPKENPSWFARNTCVLLQPKASSKLLGDMKMWYTRLSVGFVLETLRSIPRDNATHVHDLLPILSQMTGVSFTPDDLLNDPLPPGNTVTVRAGRYSYLFTPLSEHTLRFDNIPLSSAIVSTMLSGFVPPSAP